MITDLHTGGMPIELDVGDLVRVRGREWVVEALKPGASRDGLSTVELACIDDDAQGERLRAVLESEIDPRLVQDDLWQQIGRQGSDQPKVLAAHMRAVSWNTATAADRDLFQAPFRAGIRLDPYQLLPLSKALKLPRVNLLIADDVGLGKTVEAGLVLRELLLRRRVDFVVVSAPAAMITQWQDELAQNFGLGFVIVDREYLSAVRRAHGFVANPWAVGSHFPASHAACRRDLFRWAQGGARPVPAPRAVHPGRGASRGSCERRSLRNGQPVHAGGTQHCRAVRAPAVSFCNAPQRALEQLFVPPKHPRPAALHARHPGRAG